MSFMMKEKSITVLIVSQFSASRNIVSDALKELGFSNFITVSSMKEALALLEVESITWVISTLEADLEINCLHLLKIINENSNLFDIKLSFFYDKNVESAIPTAFERGALSCHLGKIEKKFVKSELSQLFNNLESNEYDSCLTAAGYLRSWLMKHRRFNALEVLERSIFSIHPNKPEFLLRIAESCFLNANIGLGMASLWQASLLDESLKVSIDELCDTYLDGQRLDEPTKERAFNALGVKCVVVLDPDEASINSIKSILEGVGIPGIHTFTDTEMAWEYLKNNEEPDLIIHEWRLPALPGPMFIQRIRNYGFTGVPIIVVSALIESKDTPILDEMTVSNIVPKPIEKKTMLESLVWTVQQDSEPTEKKSQELKIRKLLSKGEVAEARDVLGKYLVDTSVFEQSKVLLKAEYAFATKRYCAARDGAMHHISLSGESILNLNLLGRSLLKLGDYKTALDCFKNTMVLSPQNIERLCIIAETQDELGNSEQAEEALSTAEGIDSENTVFKETAAKMSLTSGDTTKAKKIMEDLGSLNKIISYMNNRAIALAHCDQVASGIELYENTLKAIPKDQVESRCSVQYNLGLAFVRDDQHEQAVELLDYVINEIDNPTAKVWKKAVSLHSRLVKASENKEAFELASGIPKSSSALTMGNNLNDAENNQDDEAGDLEEELREAHASIASALKVERGSYCCFTVFTNLDELDEITLKLIADQPNYINRSSIKRKEALGIERELKRK